MTVQGEDLAENARALGALRQIVATGQSLARKLNVEDAQSQRELVEIFSLAELLVWRMAQDEDAGAFP